MYFFGIVIIVHEMQQQWQTIIQISYQSDELMERTEKSTFIFSIVPLPGTFLFVMWQEETLMSRHHVSLWPTVRSDQPSTIF